jgi:hypothetical protein
MHGAGEDRSIKSFIEKTQVEGDGILDRTGKAYRFDIQGEGAGAILRSWKNGNLFR